MQNGHAESRIFYWLGLLQDSNGLLQDVAYSVTKLKYDSGDEQTISHMTLKSKYSHTMAFYQYSCFESSYILCLKALYGEYSML